MTDLNAAVATADFVQKRDQTDLLARVQDLEVTIPTRDVTFRAVRGVSFDIHKSKTMVLVGESGSGKSVTARAIVGLRPTPASKISGSIQILGEEVAGLNEKQWRRLRGSKIAMVFQDPTRSLDPTMKIGRQITEGIREQESLTKKLANERALELLSVVGFSQPKQRIEEYPHQLSGGMRQRVMMAIAISCNPDIIIADEPTTALDVTTEAQIMELLCSLQDQFKMGLLLITHNMGLAFTYGDEIAVMYAGQIVEQSPTNDLLRNVRMPYTRGLLDSVPSIDDDPHTPFLAMSGRSPDARSVIEGCAFCERCPQANGQCAVSAPHLVGDRHKFACWHPLGIDETQ